MPAAARRAHPRPARSRADGAAFTMTDAVRVARPFATAESSLPTEKGRLDAESQEWLDALTGTGRRQRDAIERLHALLLRAASFELARRRRALTDSRPGELDDLATQAAADALMAILRKLHTYRGDSRFSTWAYKFALLEAAVRVRRRSWQDREVPLEDDGWAQLADRALRRRRRRRCSGHARTPRRLPSRRGGPRQPARARRSRAATPRPRSLDVTARRTPARDL